MANLPPQLPGASLSGSHGGLREVAGTVRDLRAGRVKVTALLWCAALAHRQNHVIVIRVRCH